MAQVIRTKSRTPGSLNYNSFMTLDFGEVTLAASQANTVVQARIPLLLNVKIIGVSLVPHGSVAGTASFNVVSGVAAENGLPITDQSLAGALAQIPSPTAVAGNQLFAADQVIVPTADLVQNYYPAVFDAIFAAGSQLTLRLATNGSAAGSVRVLLYAVPVDNHPTSPQSALTYFVPGPNTL